MANTGTTQLNDITPAEIVAQTIIATARAAIVCAPLVFLDPVHGSNVKSYPRFAKLSAAALTSETDATVTSMTDTQVSVTLGEVGIGVTVEDTLTVAGAAQDIAMKIAMELGLAFADKVEVDLLALASSLTKSVGVTNTASNEDTFGAGIYNSELGDILGRPLAFIGFPRQLHELAIAIGGVTENVSAIYSRGDILSRLGPGLPNGFKWNLWGVDCFSSTNVPTANSSVDSLGMFLVPGMDSPITLGVGADASGSLWWARRELQRDASLRGTEIWVTGYYGASVTAPERGCAYLSRR